MKVVTVVGARPQFVKAAVMSRTLRRSHREILVHTGQHYDACLSEVFFDELGIPQPEHNLEVGSGSHATQTAAMLRGLEPILARENPDWVVVYGDTNSTAAAALAGAKLCLPVVHVEAGLRSFNRAMPEEINRIVADHLSDLLLCPAEVARQNLVREGLGDRAVVIGDVMAEALQFAVSSRRHDSGLLEALHLRETQYSLLTVHRSHNTDNSVNLRSILQGIEMAGELTVFPVHPRTRQALAAAEIPLPGNVRATEPLGYLDMIQLAASARLVLTDSGGLQKEAYWLGVPCVTLRDETEWTETVTTGWNTLVGAKADRIATAIRHVRKPAFRPPLYIEGGGAERAVALMVERLGSVTNKRGSRWSSPCAG